MKPLDFATIPVETLRNLLKACDPNGDFDTDERTDEPLTHSDLVEIAESMEEQDPGEFSAWVCERLPVREKIEDVGDSLRNMERRLNFIRESASALLLDDENEDRNISPRVRLSIDYIRKLADLS